MQEKYLKNKPIVTEIAPISKWWAGEDYHQQYCESISRSFRRPWLTSVVDNNPGGYECPTHQFYW